MNMAWPLVTIIIPCRNELAHIRQCLDSLLANDYPQDKMEILVVDGSSSDGTREIVMEYTGRYTFVRLLDNPQRITPVAMNIGIRNAKGEVLAIVGAHATYDRLYLSECVRHLKEYQADQVGAFAMYVPGDDTLVGRGIAIVLHHPFGAGANIGYKLGVREPTWVDTVSSGCYRRDVFDRVGLFNEELVRSQDIEFNRRIRRIGGRILLVPSAIIRYYCRSRLQSFCRNNFDNGIWVIRSIFYSDVLPISLRHVVPFIFVAALLGSGTMALGHRIFLSLFLLIASSYLAVAFLVSLGIAFRRRDPRYLFVMPVVFGSLHFMYGLGSFWAACKALLTPSLWNRFWACRSKVAHLRAVDSDEGLRGVLGGKMASAPLKARGHAEHRQRW
jgi:glycosyltransferase involved in cell wall biosynthesis